MRQSKCSPALSDAVTKHFQGMLRFDRYHAAIAAVCCVFISMASVFGVTVLPNLPSGGGSTFAVGRLSSGVCYYGSEREGDNSPALHEGAEFAGYDDWYSYDLHWGSWTDLDGDCDRYVIRYASDGFYSGNLPKFGNWALSAPYVAYENSKLELNMFENYLNQPSKQIGPRTLEWSIASWFSESGDPCSCSISNGVLKVGKTSNCCGVSIVATSKLFNRSEGCYIQIWPRTYFQLPEINVGLQSQGRVVATISNVTPESSVYYSIDGTVPEIAEDNKYSAPFEISSDCSISAILVSDDGRRLGNIVTESVVISNFVQREQQEYSYSIPVNHGLDDSYVTISLDRWIGFNSFYDDDKTRYTLYRHRDYEQEDKVIASTSKSGIAEVSSSLISDTETYFLYRFDGTHGQRCSDYFTLHNNPLRLPANYTFSARGQSVVVDTTGFAWIGQGHQIFGDYLESISEGGDRWIKVLDSSSGLKLNILPNDTGFDREATVWIGRIMTADETWVPKSVKIMQKRKNYIGQVICETTNPDYVSITWQPDYVDLDEKELADLEYNIYRSTTEDGEQHLISHQTETSIKDLTAEPGVRYFYWIEAVSRDKRSQKSMVRGCRYPCHLFELREIDLCNSEAQDVVVNLSTNVMVWRASSNEWCRLFLEEGVAVGSVRVCVSESPEPYSRSCVLRGMFDTPEGLAVDSLTVRQKGRKKDLLSYTIVGPDAIIEGRGTYYKCYAGYDDGIKSEIAPLNSSANDYPGRGSHFYLISSQEAAELSMSGQLYARNVTEPQTVEFGAWYEEYGRTNNATKMVTVYPFVTKAVATESNLNFQEYDPGSALDVSGWCTDVTAAHEGVYSLKCIEPSELSTMANRGAISFWCRLSEEFQPQRSCLGIKLNNKLVMTLQYSDAKEWTEFFVPIAKDNTVVTWEYYAYNGHQSDGGSAYLDTISMHPFEVSSIEIDCLEEFEVNKNFDLVCRACYNDGSSAEVVPVWSIKDGTTIAEISSRGTIRVLRAGDVTVRAVYEEGGKSVCCERKFHVKKELLSVAVVGSDELYVGDCFSYGCLASYSDGSSEMIDGVWKVSDGNNCVALSVDGVLRALAGGVAEISVSLEHEGVLKIGGKRINILSSISVPASLTGGELCSVPVSWVDGFPEFRAIYGAELSLVMSKLTGKKDASGSLLNVWHDYVAGTNPTDEKDVFRARIEFVDGRPVVTWSPNLNESYRTRTYKVYGRRSLSCDDAWEYPANSAVHRFFKVDVSMPGENDGGSDIPGAIDAWQSVAIPTAVNGLVYDGTVKQGVLPRTGYTLSGSSATGAGNYIASAVLEGGYRWVDGSQMNLQVPWSIAKANNAWLSEPAMTATTFLSGSPVTVIDGVSKFGTVTRNYSDSAIQSLAAGSYTLVSTVSSTANYMGLTHSIPFMVTGPATKVALPSAKTGLVYTGTTQTGVATGTGYTLRGNTGINAGSYTAIVTLKDGYEWSDGVSSQSRGISWSIAKATNSWLTQPSLSSTEFEEGTSVTISLGSVKFGVCQANYTAAELAQLAAGSYTLVVSVVGTDNYTGLTKSIPFTVMAKPTVSNLYCVIDLSAGASAKSYSVEYVDDEPSGGWNDVYKTSKLVLRRVEKGSFSMMSKGKTSISKDFYVGVFEVTQKQYELVMGTNPASGYGVGDTLPVYKVSYDDIRGASAGAGWPTSSAVDGESFLGKLRARTSIDFDLPTEAQWEYACRAGTTGKYYWTEAGLSTSQCAWYISNSGGVAHNVGTKRSNDWGIFDMSGNVSEWCRDWYSSTLAYGNDPKGAASASYNRRMIRGGCYSSGESGLRMDDTNYRSGVDAATRSSSTGFRLVMPK